MSNFSSIIGVETVSAEVADVNPRERMNLVNNYVFRKTPKFVDLGFSPTNTADKLNSVFAPATRAEGLMNSSNWLASSRGIG